MLMFDCHSPIGQTHIELTDKCNASCPHCSRTDIRKERAVEGVGQHELTLHDFQNFIPDSVYQNTRQWKLCGTHGDPLVARDCLEISRYIRTRSNAPIIVNSNGSLRDKEWWRQLGEIPNIEVWFGIDGLDQETHNIYRINTKLNTILTNAKAFIHAGGQAVWQTIAFKHNEHQIELMRQASIDNNFSDFVLIRNTRQTGLEQFPSKYTYKGNLYELESPDNPNYLYQTNISEPKKITCKFHKTNDIYIGSTGHVLNCCHVGAALHRFIIGRGSNVDKILKTVDLDFLNFRKTHFEEIPTQSDFFTKLQLAWPSYEPKTCKIKCSGMISERVIATG
jgi:MoaA/NifB/PqqE/SkfB family radical SAM enzyme